MRGLWGKFGLIKGDRMTILSYIVACAVWGNLLGVAVIVGAEVRDIVRKEKENGA